MAGSFARSCHDTNASSLYLLERGADAGEGESLMERWRMRDPFEVVARLQEQERRRQKRSREAAQERARQGLEELFREVGHDNSNQTDRR